MLMGLGIGLAEPKWGRPEVPRLTVHILLDASRSMLAADVNGKTRWEAAVSAVKDIVTGTVPSSAAVSCGVDLMTGDAIPLLPPGGDVLLICDALDAVEPGEIGSAGSGVGVSIEQLASRISPKGPAIVLLLSDGEESVEPVADSIERATAALRRADVPLYAIAFGGAQRQAILLDVSEGDADALETTAHPEMLEALAASNRGALISAQEAASVIEALSEARLPMPISRTAAEARPEWGAWLALVGLAVWLCAAGRPVRKWRLVFGLALLFQANPAQAAGPPLPPSVRAWLAGRALVRGDLPAAKMWRPAGGEPGHRLLAACIDLRTGDPGSARLVLEPLVGQGASGAAGPIPRWRVPALLLAARAEMGLGQPEKARALLECALLEFPGHREAAHNLQSIVQDMEGGQSQSEPPQSAPRRNAAQDEITGFRNRLPKKTKGAKDI
jgi:hypothetical protein